MKLRRELKPLRHFIVAAKDYDQIWMDDSIRHHWLNEHRVTYLMDSSLDEYMYYILLL